MGTSSLTFTITNPNTSASLFGVAFVDTLPVGVTVMSSVSVVCGGTFTTSFSTSMIALSGATIGPNSQCQFAVTVTGTTQGTFSNVTSNVTSTNGGTGNFATADLVVQPLITSTPTVTPTHTPTSTPTVTNTPTITPTFTPVPNGGACSLSSACQSRNCVAGVCCNTACTGPLMRCNLAGQVGTCASDAAAAPTLTPWGLLGASVLLAGIAGLALRRRMRGH
jgi:hypothetical protein